MRSLPTLRSFFSVAFETVPVLILVDNDGQLCRSFKRDHRALPLSAYVPLPHMVDGVLSSAFIVADSVSEEYQELLHKKKRFPRLKFPKIVDQFSERLLKPLMLKA